MKLEIKLKSDSGKTVLDIEIDTEQDQTRFTGINEMKGKGKTEWAMKLNPLNLLKR